MNTISGDILAMVHKAVRRAEEEGIGLVIGNQGTNFSVGANLMMLAVATAEGAWDDVNMAVRAFQKATMALKYARVPVVAAPFGMTLGGGCEFCLHSDAINAHAETYMGLVEIGVGLLPAGGGAAVGKLELASNELGVFTESINGADGIAFDRRGRLWVGGEVKFPLTEQLRVYRMCERHMQLATEYVDSQLREGVTFDGSPLCCHATTRKGTACQRVPLPGSKYCPSHQHLEEDFERAAGAVAA